MPRIAAGLGGLNWSEVRNLIEGILGVLPLPVVVYGEFLEGIAADEPCLEDHEEVSAGVGPVIFGRGGDPRWRVFSNFSPTPIVIEGRDYPTVEHYYQASKASTDWEHELIRAARSPKEAKLLGCRVQLRPDWENVKVNLMRTGLLAKFRQHPRCRALLLETGDVPIHEVSPGDNEWGRINGSGRDLLGRLLVEVRAILRREDLGDDPESAP
ncbi:MAG: NADAR domain-containing protein [Acidobacteriia bacterium]|nr:NADAR domain-containing protein [Terriglobia bacterium]